MPQANVQGGVWTDSFSPPFASGAGPAAPTDVILAAAAAGDTTMDIHGLGFNESQDDRQYCSVQFAHNMLIPAVGNVPLSPHVHFTFASEPTAGRTVIWKVSYVFAKPGLTALTAGVFAATPSILPATYTTTSDPEIRRHLIVEPDDVDIPVADVGPSLIIMFTVKLDNASTVDVLPIYLGCDWHYKLGPFGSVGEYL